MNQEGSSQTVMMPRRKHMKNAFAERKTDQIQAWVDPGRCGKKHILSFTVNTVTLYPQKQRVTQTKKKGIIK